jgi:hypothetical protein
LRAHDALAQLAPREGAAIRNALGHRLVVGALAGTEIATEQTLDALAAQRLLQLRAALALYRNQYAQWPARLDDLVGAWIPRLPMDPWARPDTTLRYSTANGVLYSIGANERDDGGSFAHSLSRAADYGLRLPR